MSFPSYANSDTADGQLDADLLYQQIVDDPAIVTAFASVSGRAQLFTLAFEQAPTEAEEARCDAIVAAHIGARTGQAVDYRLSVQVTGDARLVADTDWVTCGGVVTDPSAQGDVASIVGSISGEALVSGSAEIRMIETNGEGVVVDLMPNPLTLPDSGGGYAPWTTLTTEAPRAGRNTYEMQARVGADGDTASLRWVSIALVVVG